MIGCRVIKQLLFKNNPEGLELLRASSENIVLVLEMLGMLMIDSEMDILHRDLQNLIKVKKYYKS